MQVAASRLTEQWRLACACFRKDRMASIVAV